MVDQNVLSSRLNALERYLERLEAFSQIPLEEFLAEEDVHHLAERYLHLACECMIDIGQHVISDMGYRQPEGYRDVMRVFAEEGIFDSELADRLAGWVGFRNVLVHLYVDIDHSVSYRTIVEELGDLRAFAEKMAVFIEP